MQRHHEKSSAEAITGMSHEMCNQNQKNNKMKRKKIIKRLKPTSQPSKVIICHRVTDVKIP